MKVFVLLLCLLCFFAAISANAQPVWQANLDGKVQFYQTTDFGIVLAGSENSLYAHRRAELAKGSGAGSTEVWTKLRLRPIPATDLILLSLDEGDKSRVEAIDLLSGATLWRSDKVKGDVMQLAVEPEADLLAVVLVKKAKGKIGEEFKRTPHNPRFAPLGRRRALEKRTRIRRGNDAFALWRKSRRDSFYARQLSPASDARRQALSFLRRRDQL